MRGHTPIPLTEFKGVWRRGDPFTVPLDHLDEANNLDTYGQNGIQLRPGVGILQDVLVPLTDIKRVFNYPTETSNGLIILTWDGTTGKVYHYEDETSTIGPILTIVGMEDIDMEPFNGKAFITPFKTYPDNNGINFEKGMQGEFLYVYLGDGSQARKAAGSGPAGTLTIANGAAGYTDAGIHVFGVVGETDSGYLSAPVALNNFTTGAALSVSFSTVPTFTGSQWVRRHIVASKAIPTFNGDNTGYTLYFIPGATINDNVSTTLSNISFYDADLLEDASHLLDNYDEIPAGTCLCMYHNRLCLGGTYDNPHLILVSAAGEPEAINQIDGFLTMPADGNPVNNVSELRDVLYGFKRSKTAGWVDNNGEPTSWPYIAVDDALGTSVHGIATHLDSGSSVGDFLYVATYRGLCLFNGRYQAPELSWKIQADWVDFDRNEFRKIQILDNPIDQAIYVVTPERNLLKGYYGNGLNPEDIQWWPWSFDFKVNTIGIININDFIIGADIV